MDLMEIKSAQIETAQFGVHTVKLVESNPVIDIPKYGEVRALCLFINCPGWQSNDASCKYGHPKPTGYVYTKHCLNRLFCQKCIDTECKLTESHSQIEPLPYEKCFIEQHYNGEKQRVHIQIFKFEDGNYYRNVNKYFGKGTALRLPGKAAYKTSRVVKHETPVSPVVHLQVAPLASSQTTVRSPALHHAVSYELPVSQRIASQLSTPSDQLFAQSELRTRPSLPRVTKQDNYSPSMVRRVEKLQQPINKRTSYVSPTVGSVIVDDAERDDAEQYDAEQYDAEHYDAERDDAEQYDAEQDDSKRVDVITPVDYKRMYDDYRRQTELLFRDILLANESINTKADAKFKALHRRIEDLTQELNEIRDEINKAKNEITSDMDEITAKIMASEISDDESGDAKPSAKSV